MTSHIDCFRTNIQLQREAERAPPSKESDARLCKPVHNLTYSLWFVAHRYSFCVLICSFVFDVVLLFALLSVVGYTNQSMRQTKHALNITKQHSKHQTKQTKEFRRALFCTIQFLKGKGMSGKEGRKEKERNGKERWGREREWERNNAQVTTTNASNDRR